MLRTDINWPDHRKFKSNTEYEPLEFFSECLRNSKRFDFFLGFFSSSAIRLLSCSFATFLHNGGKMRLIINNILSEEDKQTIINAENGIFKNIFNINDLRNLRDTLSKRDQHFFECMAWLLGTNRIEIKIIKPKESNGISHAKEGVFYDDVDIVSFTGSCNFSKSAIIDNIESLSTFCSWDLGPSWANVSDTRSCFERTFSMEDSSVTYLNVSDILTQITDTFGQPDIIKLLKREQELLEEELSEIPDIPSNNRIRKILEKAKRKSDEIIEAEIDKIDTPHFPYPQGPREYQKIAFENWKSNGQKGLFAMATGTGKTITALNCLLEIYQRCGYYKAIILVPTIALVEQWEKECRKFSFNKILKVCSKTKDWKSWVSQIKMMELTGERKTISYVIIATYASFIKQQTFNELNGFSKKQVLLISDEAHNLGSRQISQRLNDIKYLRRIGLSATPERQFDDSGNKKISEFFNCINGYTFEYNMEAAIESGALCRYYYYPHIVRLTDDELSAYVEISEKISKIINFQDDDNQDALKKLFLKRKRIIHKATNKKEIFKNIIHQQLKANGHLNYTLVYVPEGNKTDYESADIFESTDVINDESDSQHLIDQYTKIISDSDPHVTVRQFTSDSENRDELLDEYATGKIQVLTSMKCLDEGIDIPRSEFAIFCSSTGNPRQFIQRRGRVLRTHPDKHIAKIHDLIVIPDNCFKEGCYALEKKLVESEIKRVRNFALLSENLNDTDHALEDVLFQYNLSIFN